ncbi:helix-turn-helix domain-containing protein [Butyrivibrio sp. X503]|uniref:helix-turn-helix domain-containing protein n=1 Tax=Butyrivibrio sp. X503 TaxID=2364878 RepID=UPI001314C4EF|nr:helix-turn-helix transcriptional regulator [Butyrivibrio sp. X503]
MQIDEYLKSKNISLYKLAELSGVSYTTVFNLINGKSDIYNCALGKVLPIAKALELSVEELAFLCDRKYSFTLFKSEQCHLVSRMGQVEYIIEVLEDKKIDQYWRLCCYAEAMYMVGMIDYLSRLNDIQQCTNYDHIREHKLKDKIYPIDAAIENKLSNKKARLKKLEENAIPEFMRFNIVEGDVLHG